MQYILSKTFFPYIKNMEQAQVIFWSEIKMEILRF